LQTAVFPSGHTVASPAAHAVKSQLPFAPVGHSSEQLEPASQLAWHGGASQTNAHELFGPQVQLPLAQAPSQRGLSPSQITWHGGPWQAKVQLASRSQVHSPLPHSPVQSLSGRHST
jgi:hypothetical protein